MKRKNYDTVTEAMADLKKMGYTIDFSILTEKECLICHFTATELSPEDFEIDQFYRFEGDSDPGDEMIVYAISSANKNLKGIVVSAYGMYADNASSAIVKKLNTHPKH
ncbi:phosphoribosylpyrophosphate synthetase [Bizionia hallyeonensis]|uniref:Phosphoribosylpyrophosphate synthetase n=1 Tax=Bizionia hallyeonensis TaxID=1123757 RepID=A0ABW0C0U8_9FLAO